MDGRHRSIPRQAWNQYYFCELNGKVQYEYCIGWKTVDQYQLQFMKFTQEVLQY